jgi:hypothetical protein
LAAQNDRLKDRISNSDLRFDMRVGLVVEQIEIFVIEIEEGFDVGVELHLGKRVWVAGKL